jgi:hypothetical protein
MKSAINDFPRIATLLTVSLATILVQGCTASIATDQASGDGSADRTLLVPAPGSPIPCPSGALAAGDLNGDTCADLLVGGAKSLMVFFGSPAPWPRDRMSASI